MRTTYYDNPFDAAVAAQKHVAPNSLSGARTLTLLLNDRTCYNLDDPTPRDYPFVRGFFDREQVEDLLLEQFEHGMLITRTYDAQDVYDWLQALDPHGDARSFSYERRDRQSLAALYEDVTHHVRFLALFRDIHLVTLSEQSVIICLTEQQVKDAVLSHRHRDASETHVEHVAYDDSGRLVRTTLALDAAHDRIRRLPFLD